MTPSILKPELLETDLLPFARCHQNTSAYLSPHVHFPPTPILTSSQRTHSPTTYDRAPIEVTPNACALPERGGRAYFLPDDATYNSPTPKRSYFHPRAFEACERESLEDPPAQTDCPPLIHDLSTSCSESDDLDSPCPSFPISKYSPTPLGRASSQEEFDHALLFLPHPPQPIKGCLKPRRRKNIGRQSANDVLTNPETHLDSCLDGF